MPSFSEPSRFRQPVGFFSLLLVVLLAVGCGAGAPTPEGAGEAAPPPPAPSPPVGPVIGQTPSADGVEIAYTVWHHSDPEATALVFVHGWECDRGYWREQIDAFDDDHTVVTLDLAGHGDSGTDREDWQLATFGQDVAAVVNALDLERTILIGHSMGGPAVLEAAPLLGERVVGLVGVDTFHNVEFKVPAEQWDGLMAAYRSDYLGTCDQFVGSMFPPDADPALATRIRDDMCSGPQDIGLALMERFGQYDGAAAFERAAATGAPIRAINSDAAFPTDLEADRRHAPDFDATILHDVGHFLMLERPAEFNQSLGAVVVGLGLN